MFMVGLMPCTTLMGFQKIFDVSLDVATLVIGKKVRNFGPIKATRPRKAKYIFFGKLFRNRMI